MSINPDVPGETWHYETALALQHVVAELITLNNRMESIDLELETLNANGLVVRQASVRSSSIPRPWSVDVYR